MQQSCRGPGVSAGPLPEDHPAPAALDATSRGPRMRPVSRVRCRAIAKDGPDAGRGKPPARNPVQDRLVDDQRAGAALRALRIRARRTQAEIGLAAGASRTTVSRLERGHVDSAPLSTLRAVAGVLDARVVVDLRWRGGELDRLVDERHAALQGEMLRRLRRTPGWTVVPEASFAVYSERGSIDLLAWHAGRRALLIVEVKSRLIDCQDLLRTMDGRRRLGPRIGSERGWAPLTVSTWVVLDATDANRARAARSADLLRAAFPDDGYKARRWLRDPELPVHALSFVGIAHQRNVTRRFGTLERVRRPRQAPGDGKRELERGPSPPSAASGSRGAG